MTASDLKAVWEKSRVDPSIIRAALTRVPPSWTLVEEILNGAAFVRGSIQVLMSVARYEDGNIWIHASACGRRGKKDFYLPSFEELKRVKNDFIGADRWAYQVFPDEKHYVNQHPCVLHLFSLFENRPALPDFTRGTGGI
jgi:hypothetical protein